MRFQYVAIAPDGREVQGTMEAQSVREALNLLSDEGRIPVSATPIDFSQPEQVNQKSGQKSLPTKSLPAFTRRLAQMVSAGVPIEAALASLQKNSPYNVAGFLNARLKEGSSFAEALSAYGAPFDPVYIALVRAGEASGDLGAMLTQLANDLERLRETRNGLISALVYPILLLAVSIIVFSILMLFVVPRFESLFADARSELPMMTQVVIGSARLMQSLWWVPLVGFVGGFIFLRSTQNNESIKIKLSNWQLKIPVVGSLIREFETARLTRTLGALLTGGVPAYEAVSLAIETVQNYSQQVRAKAALLLMQQGKKLSAAFAHEQIANHDFIEIIEVGEASGRLGTSLLQAADIFEKNLINRLKTIVAMVEPIIIMTLGTLIGGVVISLFVAILSVNDLAF